MNFEEALKAMLEGKRAKRACYKISIAYSQKRHEFCVWHDDTIGLDCTHYGCEVTFDCADRNANDWCVISDTPSSITKAIEVNVLPLTDEEKEILSKLAKEKIQREVLFNRLEITFKSGETIIYKYDEWDDYAYDGKAVIVKRNGAWVGIYNFADVFCVELRK